MKLVVVVACVVSFLLCGCAGAPATRGTSSPSSSANAAADLKAGRQAALDKLGELTKAANAFSLAVGRCPTSIEDLVHAPNGASFIASAPNDPWGHPIAILAASGENPTSAFVSAGPDGMLLTDDDISLPIQCDQR